MEIQIISGFLGAGKTTFLNKYLKTLPRKIVVIENEFGSIGLDGDLIQADQVKEIYSGCICCSLKSDFEEGIKEIQEKYSPDIILIEPSGVARLSDIINTCQDAIEQIGTNIKITQTIAIVDVSTYTDFKEDFGPFYMDQIRNSKIILFSHFEELEEDFSDILADIKEENKEAMIYSEDFRNLEVDELKELIDINKNIQKEKIESEGFIPGDKIFSSISKENFSIGSKEKLNELLESFKNQDFGYILRAKGVADIENKKYKFDFTPKSISLEEIEEDIPSKLIVIGCNLTKKLKREIGEVVNGENSRLQMYRRHRASNKSGNKGGIRPKISRRL